MNLLLILALAQGGEPPCPIDPYTEQCAVTPPDWDFVPVCVIEQTTGDLYCTAIDHPHEFRRQGGGD